MVSLPEGIADLTMLHTLDLSECKELAELPEGVRALTKLRTLNLKSCSSLTLPTWLRELTSLQTLVVGLWVEELVEDEDAATPAEADARATRKKQFVRVRPHCVDLTAHTGLVALPEDLLACAWFLRKLVVKSDRLEAQGGWKS